MFTLVLWWHNVSENIIYIIHNTIMLMKTQNHSTNFLNKWTSWIFQKYFLVCIKCLFAETPFAGVVMETSRLSLIKHCHEINQIKPLFGACLSLPPSFTVFPSIMRISWNMVSDPAPSRTSPGLSWDGLRDLLFCHWFSKALREGGRVFGPSDSLSRDYWFRLWSEPRRQMFRCDGFWLGA